MIRVKLRHQTTGNELKMKAGGAWKFGTKLLDEGEITTFCSLQSGHFKHKPLDTEKEKGLTFKISALQ